MDNLNVKNKELLDLYLPKWPQMLVSGRKIIKQDALEIIRRTDSFFSWGGGNDREYVKNVYKMLKIPEMDDYEDYRSYASDKDAWEKKWNYIGDKFEYVHNSWISNAFIYGPSGWCHPDGKIEFFYNVGKWPSCEDIYDEWAAISKYFPTINLAAVLFDGEHSEDTKPVIGFLIKGGGVEIYNPNVGDLLCGFPIPKKDDDLEDSMIKTVSLMPSQREHGIDSNVIKKWQMYADKVIPNFSIRTSPEYEARKRLNKINE